MMVPSMTYQVLHNPELLKLDLSSIVYVTAGAAHLPPELRAAFNRRAKNLPFFYEGSDISYHQWVALICNLQGTGCPNAYVSQTVGRSMTLSRLIQTYAALFLPFPGMFGGRVNPVRCMTGILNPSLEARIVREDGSDADYNEIGELILRGPTIALGYWNNEKETRETFKNGWLYTGDRFYVDKQERFLYARCLGYPVTMLKRGVL